MTISRSRTVSMCRILYDAKTVSIGYTTSMAVKEIRVPSRGMQKMDVHMVSVMSRYIDADALHDALKAKQKWVVRCGDKHNEGYTYDQVHFAIDDAPSIDIVRCKECKWAKANGTYQWCGRLDSTARITADDFCSYGERRE